MMWTMKDIGLAFADKAINQFLPGLDLDGSTDTTLLNFVPDKEPYTSDLWISDIITGLRFKYPLYIFGPSGSGKTAAIKYIASNLVMPVFEITGHSRLEFPELVGGYHVTNGNMVWHDGPLTRALRYGGIFLLNEQSLIDPATAAGLNSILDGSPLLIPETGELIKPHEYFFYVATDNTNGNGDDTGLYLGTLRQNTALLNRMMFVRADYLPAQVEQKLIKSVVPSLDDDTIAHMVQFANSVRDASEGKAVDDARVAFVCSVRDLIRWAQLQVAFANVSKMGKSSLLYALDRAMLYRASQTDRATLLEFIDRVF